MHSHKKHSHTGSYLSRFAETQVKARLPAVARNIAFLAVAGLASLFALVWISYALFTLLHESFGWSRPLAGLVTAVFFGGVGAAFLGARKAFQKKEEVKRELEKDLVAARIPELSPVHGLKTAIRQDASEMLHAKAGAAGVALREKSVVLREKGEVAMEWVAEHPVRAAAIGAATGWLVGMWTRKTFTPIEGV